MADEPAQQRGPGMVLYCPTFNLFKWMSRLKGQPTTARVWTKLLLLSTNAHRSLTGAPGSLQMSVAMPTVPTPEMTASASAFTSSREAPAAAAAPATCVAHTVFVNAEIQGSVSWPYPRTAGDLLDTTLRHSFQR